jgi:hypothetical protein
VGERPQCGGEAVGERPQCDGGAMGEGLVGGVRGASRGLAHRHVHVPAGLVHQMAYVDRKEAIRGARRT